MKRTSRLFVYGSLMRGQEAHRLLVGVRGARRVGRGWIGARLYDLGRYPGAMRDVGGRVYGELWEMDSRAGALASLDRYEGVDRRAVSASVFVRRRASVALSNGRIVRAWAYFLRRAPATVALIESGDWRYTRRSRPSQYGARISRFKSLPDGLRGISATKSTERGRL